MIREPVHMMTCARCGRRFPREQMREQYINGRPTNLWHHYPGCWDKDDTPTSLKAQYGPKEHNDPTRWDTVRPRRPIALDAGLTRKLIGGQPVLSPINGLHLSASIGQIRVRR